MGGGGTAPPPKKKTAWREHWQEGLVEVLASTYIEGERCLSIDTDSGR